MTLLEGTLFDQAMFGAPVTAPVASPPASFEDLGGWWVQLPRVTSVRAPDTQKLIRDLRCWTSWATRATAEALATSHTTVQALEAGRPLMAARSGDLRRRLYELHELVSRLRLLADDEPTRTRDLLCRPDAHGLSPLAYLQEGQAAKAYLAAIDAVKPRRRAGLLVGDRPATPGTATSPLVD